MNESYEIAKTPKENYIFRDSASVSKKARLDRNQGIQKFCKRIALVHIPGVVVVFTVSYWFIGLRNAKLI